MRGVLELPVAWKAGTRRPFSRAHGVALAGDRQARATRFADVAGGETQVIDRADAVAAVGGLVDAHGPDRHCRIRLAVEARDRADGVLVDATDPGRCARVVVGHRFGECLETGSVRSDVGLVVEAILKDDVAEAVQQHKVRARGDGQVDVRELGEHGHPGINHDDRELALLESFLESPVDDRVLLREVRAEREKAVGVVKVHVAAGRAVGTEGALVAGHRRRHAQGGVAIVVVGADDPADQLAEGVELLGHDLAGGNDGHRIAAVLGLDALEGPGDAVQCLVPVATLPVLEGAVANLGRAAAAGCREYLGLGQSLDAELAAVDIGPAHAAGGDWLAARVDAHLDGAADRTVAAGRVLPLGHRLGGDAYRVLLGSSEEHGLRRLTEMSSGARMTVAEPGRGRRPRAPGMSEWQPPRPPGIGRCGD